MGSKVKIIQFPNSKSTIHVCMVDICKWNDKEGGCLVEWGHTQIIFKNGKAMCECFEYKEV